MTTRNSLLFTVLLCLGGLASKAQWSLTGNSGTSGSNFLGTTDGQALLIKTNGTTRLEVSGTGNVSVLTPLGSGTDTIFSIFGGQTSINSNPIRLFEQKNSGQFLFRNAAGNNVLAFTGSHISVGSGIEVNFHEAGQTYVNYLRAYKLKGYAWDQSEIFIDRPGIIYKAIGNNQVETGDYAHRFTVVNPLTNSDTYVAGFDNGGSPFMVINKDGKVGVGTSNPLYTFHANGKSYLQGSVDIGTSHYGDADVALSVNSSALYLLGLYNQAGLPRMQVDQNGNGRLLGRLGVGTLTPNASAQLDVVGNAFVSGKLAVGFSDSTKMNGYALAVNGNALFTRATVKLYGNWPDYVFDKQYKLMPIQQLEQYIQINKHLPGVTPAANIQQNGIDLGTGQAQLLEKVEELTLYIIELNKKVAQLEKESAAAKAVTVTGLNK